MRIALVGKGGSGKTTVGALLWRVLVQRRLPVLAIDADINQHLAAAIGWQVENVPDLGNHLPVLKQLLRGENPLILSDKEMVKTTLPGTGSHLVTLTPDDVVLQTFAVRDRNSWLMRVGGFAEEDLGIRCFHAKTGGAELVLNHLIDKPTETVLVDMTAGADAFSSGLFSRFDMTLLVVEPTLKSVSVYRQYKAYAQQADIAVRVVGNKVADAADRAFLAAECGDDLVGCLTSSLWVRQAERGQAADIALLESENLAVLERILAAGAEMPRDWQRYWALGRHYHRLNAESWANAAVGADTMRQIDELFLRNFQPERVWGPAEPKVVRKTG